MDEPGYDDGTPATGSVTVNGSEQSVEINPCAPSGELCPQTIYDTGTVSVAVNGFWVSVSYGETSTPTSIATSLRDSLNSTVGSPVTATASGATLTLTTRQIGQHTNYSLSVDWSWDTTNFVNSSFTATKSGNTLTGGTDGTGANGHPPSLNTPFVTTHAYDALNSLTVTTQGVQQRRFTYDSMGRLLTATTPEAGTVTYAYNSFSLVSTRTDARNAVTTYGYDALNRLQTVSYSVPGGVAATPTVTLNYDVGGAASNGNGRLTSMTDGVGSETYTYDMLGRITQLGKLVSGLTYNIQYAYNYASEITSLTYPSNRVVVQSFDAIGRLCAVGTSGATCSSGTNFLSNIAYNAAFEPTTFSYGNGAQGGLGYNAQLQLASLAYTKGASTLFSVAYDYGTGNNGQIQSITDNVDSTRTTAYTYDAWARLKIASNAQWTITETYDRYGNRNAQSPPRNFSQAANPSTNRLPSPYGYDLAGNMTNDVLNTMTYDGENRVATSATGGVTTNYSYDGNGLRVKKQVGPATPTVYLFSGEKVIAEYAAGAAASSPQREYIYSGSQLLAKIEGAGTSYYHPDHLSVRVTTDTTGTVIGTQGHYPFGEQWYPAPPQIPSSKWQFTSYERDSESGNDYAMFRSYINPVARFSIPDAVAGSPANPQSLNRFSYVYNDPINSIDPFGLWCIEVALFNNPDIETGQLRYVGTALVGTTCGGRGSGGGHPVPGLDLGTDEGGGGNSSGGPSFWTVSKNLNRCAAQLSQTKSFSAISGGRIPEFLGSNFFGDISSLATGSGGLDQGAGIATEGTIQIAERAAAQVAITTVTTISKPISATAGVYNPVAVGTASQSFGGTIVGRLGLGALKVLSVAKIGWDAAMYLAAEAACAAPAWQ